MTRRLLVWVIAALAALLSFDALRAYALNGGVIPNHTILARPLLAAGWAICIDLAAAAGILGIRHDRHDWRAWAMFLLAAIASVGFQVFTLPAILARAVPPVALFLAIVVLELPRSKPSAVPVPATVPAPAEPPSSGPEHPVQTRPRVTQGGTDRTRPVTLGRPLDRDDIARRLAEGQSGLAISRDLGLSQRRYKSDLLPLLRELRAQPVQVGHPNGSGGGS